MPFEIKPCTVSDFPDVVDVEDRAWAENHFTPILFPGPFPEDKAELKAQELAKHIEDDPSGQWIKVVDTEAINSNKGIAFAKWQIFKDKLPGPRQNRDFGPGCNTEVCKQIFGHLGELREQHIGGKHCLYLQVAVTDPAYQRRGLAGRLVTWGTKQADELGLPAYVESSKAAHGVYLKHGFKDLECFELDLSEHGATELHQIWSMMYEPNALSE